MLFPYKLSLLPYYNRCSQPGVLIEGGSLVGQVISSAGSLLTHVMQFSFCSMRQEHTLSFSHISVEEKINSQTSQETPF